MMKWLFDNLSTFWSHHPALLYGIASLLGCSFGLCRHPAILFPLIILSQPSWVALPRIDAASRRQLLALGVFALSLLYTSLSISDPFEGKKTVINGTAIFEIDGFKKISKHYGFAWLYTGRVRSFYSEGRLKAANLPARIQLPAQAIPAKADTAYLIKGSLRISGTHSYVFTPKRNTPWTPIKDTYSFAQLRSQAKQNVSTYIHSKINKNHAANFLEGIGTGDFQDRSLGYAFSRFGLQHIMAISGFHFTIIASLLNFLLSIALPKKSATYLLLVLLFGYYMFLGYAPSILRAWISSSLALLGCLIERKSSGLNSLGVGIMIVLLFDPHACTTVGFQFSFAATAAILLIYPQADRMLQTFFPRRSLGLLIETSSLNQHAYALLQFCRQAFSLTLAVNSIAIPLTLFHFGKFPLMGLVYNLFFPFLASFSMAALLIGSILDCVLPWPASLIHAFNAAYTEFILSYTYNLPSTLDIYVRSGPFPGSLIISGITLLFFFGILAYVSADKKRDEIDDWAFL